MRKISQNDDAEERGVRSNDQSHMEVALGVRQFFEQERLQHRRISLNNVLESTALETGINKNLVYKVRKLEDIKHWKKKPDAPTSVQRASHIPENFSSVIRHVVREIYLDGSCVPTSDVILDELLQKRVQDFAHLDLFHGREIPSLSSPLWVWSRSSLYRFMKSIGFIYGDKISHSEYTKNRADVVSMRDNYLDRISAYREKEYTIYCQDETWVFKNMSCFKVWKEIVTDRTEETYRVSAGKGDRSIV